MEGAFPDIEPKSKCRQHSKHGVKSRLELVKSGSNKGDLVRISGGLQQGAKERKPVVRRSLGASN